MKASCICDCKAVLGEGPVWSSREQALFWVDIKGLRLFRHDWKGGETQTFETPFRIGAVAPRAGGGLVAATEHGFALIDPSEGRYDLVGDPEPERPGNRFNDGKVDRQGRFWAGTMDDAEQQATGALYRLSADMDWAQADDGYRVTNGPAFSRDGSIFYHSDSALQTIYRFDLAADGEISRKSVFARFGEGDGYPDGMTVDAEDCLWVAFWDGWCLRRLSPEGECIATIEMPVQRPTSCAFGGPGLDILFVTSARIGLGREALAAQPQAGGLFRVEPGVKGLAEMPFEG